MPRRLRIGFPKAFRLIADQGALALTGIDANLRRGRRIAADQGTYSSAGQAANLVYIGGGTGGGITPSLLLNGSSTSTVYGMAPYAVHCDAVGTVSSNIGARFHAPTGNTSTQVQECFRRIVYSYNYGDPGSGTWSTGNPSFNSKNVDVGAPLAAHVYETPGTYTLTCGINDGLGGTATVTRTLVIYDPDNYTAGPGEINYSGTNTVCLTNGSTGPNTWGPAGCAYQSAWPSSWSNKRVLLKAGVDYAGLGTLNVGHGVSNVLIKTYGSGAKAKISNIQLAAYYGIPDTNFPSNITLSTVEITGAGHGFAWCGTQIALHNCDFTSTANLGYENISAGFTNATYAGGGAAISSLVWPKYTFFVGCTFPNSITGQAYTIYHQFMTFGVVMGCSFGFCNGQHIMRVPHHYKSLVSHNTAGYGPANKDIFKINGGTGNVYIPGGTYQTLGDAWYSQYFVLAANSLGGPTNNAVYMATLGPQNDVQAERSSDHVVENNLGIRGGSGVRITYVGGRNMLQIGQSQSGTGGALDEATGLNMGSGSNATNLAPQWNGPYYTNRS